MCCKRWLIISLPGPPYTSNPILTNFTSVIIGTIDTVTEENISLRQAVNGLTMKIETLQTVVSDLMSIKSKFTQQPATPHVGRFPVSGSLVQTYLEGTPGARPVSFIMKEANARVS